VGDLVQETFFVIKYIFFRVLAQDTCNTQAEYQLVSFVFKQQLATEDTQ
jgi:hypothetical protein